MPFPSPPMDWLSRLLDMMPVQGHLDIRCLYGAPWRIEYANAETGEMAYHAVLHGSAILEDGAGGAPLQLVAGDILLLPHGSAHILHDGSGARAVPARERVSLNLTISENAGTGDRLDLLCGRFVLTPPHDRFVRDYLPSRMVVHTTHSKAGTGPLGTGARLTKLISMMRSESSGETLGGRAMLNALSTAMFALTLRFASEAKEPPTGLLALIGHPRLAPALAAIFDQPARGWSLPELARLCGMSRATFARHFQESLGRSASDLLTDIRMTLAANELKKSSMSTGHRRRCSWLSVGSRLPARFQAAHGRHASEWRRTTPLPMRKAR